MKIATYNIWNERKNFDKRLDILIGVLNTVEIDYLALQEVKNEKTLLYILEHTPFLYAYRENGVAFLSKHKCKLEEKATFDNNEIIRLSFEEFGFTVVHYDWEFEKNRMNGHNKVMDMIEKNCMDHEFVLGDFNASPDSKLHFEMILDDFSDLHQQYCHELNEIPRPTLDFVNNPRWRGKEVDEEPVRFDWIMLNSVSNFTVTNASVFGDKLVNGYTASDHYGVVVELDLK